MSPKRASSSENSSRQSKKRKITAARTISVQRLESGIPGRPSKSNDTDGQYIVAQYLNSRVELNFVTCTIRIVLPDSIDVEKFVEVG